MAITGEVREEKGKKVGLFVGKIIAINPDAAKLAEILGYELREDAREPEYVGDKEGTTTLKLTIWLEDVKTGFKSPVLFFLEDRVRFNKTGTKTQFINEVGLTTWTDSEDNLAAWFTRSPFREAHVGEEQLYDFARTFLGKLDFMKESASIKFDWKALMRGDVSELEEGLTGPFSSNGLVLAEVRNVDKDGETKEYQGIYNGGFLPEFSLKQFRLVDYDNEEIRVAVRAKAAKEQKLHEKFVAKVTDPEYGSKNFFILKDLQNYDPKMNIVTSDEPMESDNPKY